MKYKEKETGKIKEYQEIEKEYKEIKSNIDFEKENITDWNTLEEFILSCYIYLED